MHGTRKLLVVGLDGASFTFVSDLFRRGELPFLKQLAERGSFQPLESVKIPLTAIAWSASYTGKNPGRSNIPGFVRQRKSSYEWEYVSPSERASQEYWRILSDQGGRAILLGAIFCQNRQDFDGVFVGGEYCGDIERCVYPEELKELVVGQYGYHPYTTYGSIGEMESFIDNKFRIAAHLSQSQEWNLFFLGFMEPDTTHAYYHCTDIDFVLAAYRAIDRGLARLVGQLGPEVDIAIHSDHGNRPYAKAFHVNSWLFANGFLALKSRRAFRAHHVAQWRERLGSMPARWGWSKRLGASVYYSGRLLTKLCPPLSRLALRVAPWLPALLADERDSKVGRGEQIVIDPGVLFDYSRTTAYAFLNHGGNFAGICVNRVGQRPAGTVPDEEYELLRQRLVERLKATVEPGTGRPVVEHVWRREELFSGPYAEDLPDLVFQAGDEYFTYISEDDVSARNVVFAFANCQHELDGLLLCAGECFAEGVSVRSQIIDIAPTLLYALDCAIPSDLDGRVIEPLFRERYRVESPVRVGQPGTQLDPAAAPGYTSREQQIIERRLRDLGYLE